MVFKIAPFRYNFRVAGRQKTTTPNSERRPGSDPAFHEYIVMTVPFAPSVFLNVIFSMKICNFPFFMFSLCDVLYGTFITLLDNTTVNARPLSPPIFEKFAHHGKNKKKTVVPYVASFRLLKKKTVS